MHWIPDRVFNPTVSTHLWVRSWDRHIASVQFMNTAVTAVSAISLDGPLDAMVNTVVEDKDSYGFQWFARSLPLTLVNAAAPVASLPTGSVCRVLETLITINANVVRHPDKLPIFQPYLKPLVVAQSNALYDNYEWEVRPVISINNIYKTWKANPQKRLIDFSGVSNYTLRVTSPDSQWFQVTDTPCGIQFINPYLR